MYWHDWQFFGMHFFWWMFLVSLIVMLFSRVSPVRRKIVRLYHEEPLGILQRRYAVGEITTEEYEERKTRIARDLRDPNLRVLSRTHMDQDAPA